MLFHRGMPAAPVHGDNNHMMSFVLVISRDANCRKLYVDNLVRRGYIVVGVASADEAEKLLANVTPDLVLVCCMPIHYEQDAEKLRLKYQVTSPILLLARDKPDPVWAAKWNVTVRPDYATNLRQLAELLQLWLPAMQSPS